MLNLLVHRVTRRLTKRNFPHCLGSIDGSIDIKHVQIKKPETIGIMYFNYKDTSSIVLFGVANANYNFVYADVVCTGSKFPDGGVLKHTALYEEN
jgi:hypothetical protein